MSAFLSKAIQSVNGFCLCFLFTCDSFVLAMQMGNSFYPSLQCGLSQAWERTRCPKTAEAASCSLEGDPAAGTGSVVTRSW